jgi:hypothetical protein
MPFFQIWRLQYQKNLVKAAIYGTLHADVDRVCNQEDEIAGF